VCILRLAFVDHFVYRARDFVHLPIRFHRGDQCLGGRGTGDAREALQQARDVAALVIFVDYGVEARADVLIPGRVRLRDHFGKLSGAGWRRTGDRMEIRRRTMSAT
jgi:hypothetical protein